MPDCIKLIASAVAQLEITKMWKQSGPDDGKSLLQHIKNLGSTNTMYSRVDQVKLVEDSL